MDSNDVASNIEATINQCFGFSTTLEISNIYPDNSYIIFWRGFNNTGLRD